MIFIQGWFFIVSIASLKASPLHKQLQVQFLVNYHKIAQQKTLSIIKMWMCVSTIYIVYQKLFVFLSKTIFWHVFVVERQQCILCFPDLQFKLSQTKQ